VKSSFSLYDDNDNNSSSCSSWLCVYYYFIGPLALPRNLPSPTTEHRSKRRRLSSEEDPLDVGGSGGRDKGNEVAYYGQSPASLSSGTSWHSEVDHGKC
jgi:hypothetical protein